MMYVLRRALKYSSQGAVMLRCIYINFYITVSHVLFALEPIEAALFGTGGNQDGACLT
jgi:hypothetical protein